MAANNNPQPILFGPATPEDEGKVRICMDNARRVPCPGLGVCILKWGAHVWEPVEELSANNWMRYRDDIAVSIMRVAGRVAHADAAARPAKAAQPALPLSALGMLRDLYDKMSIQEKAAFEEEHKDASEVMAIVRRKECKGCGKIATTQRKKCLHSDCVGMCDDCHRKVKVECPACHKKQVITCPICQEECGPDDLNPSEGCCHYVCWKCYGRAAKVHRPIDKCPVCRATFTQPEVSDGGGGGEGMVDAMMREPLARTPRRGSMAQVEVEIEHATALHDRLVQQREALLAQAAAPAQPDWLDRFGRDLALAAEWSHTPPTGGPNRTFYLATINASPEAIAMARSPASAISPSSAAAAAE